MKTNKKLRFQYSLQNSFFLILFLSLVFVIGVIAKQFVYVKDMTQANRSVLTKGSIEVVERALARAKDELKRNIAIKKSEA